MQAWTTPGRADVACTPGLGAAQMRITVLGSARSADLVVPSERPVALLTPVLLEMVGGPEAGTCSLYTDVGQRMDPERSLAECGVRDGAVLRLLSRPAAPPEPVVADLVEEMDADLCSGGASPDTSRAWFLSVTGTVATTAGVALLAAAPQTSAVSVLAAGAGIEMAAAALGVVWGSSRWAWTLGGSAGGLLVVAGAAAWWAHDQPLVASCALVLSVLLVGVFPVVALHAARVLTVDRRVAEGAAVSRAEAGRAVDTAHRIMLGGLLAAGASVVLTSSAVGLWAAEDPWATGVVAAAWLTWTCRLRHFPRAAQKVTIVAASMLSLLGWLVAWISHHPGLLLWSGTGCAVAGLVLCALSWGGIGPVVSAWGRRWVRRGEAACVVAMLPLLLGQAGVYADLLASFG